MNYTSTVGYYESLPNYPSGVNFAGTLIQYSNGNEWIHSAIIQNYKNGCIYVSEHTGPSGDQSYSLHGNDLRNKRTFWISKG